MEILNYGKIHPYTTTCKNCTAELKYVPLDIKCMYFRGHYQNYIVCPMCKRKLLIQTEDPNYKKGE